MEASEILIRRVLDQYQALSPSMHVCSADYQCLLIAIIKILCSNLAKTLDVIASGFAGNWQNYSEKTPTTQQNLRPPNIDIDKQVDKFV